mgnify:CR=1 FL=1
MRSDMFFSPALGSDDEQISELNPIVREIRLSGDSLIKRVNISLAEKKDTKKKLRISGELNFFLKIRRSITDTMPLDRQYQELKSSLTKLDHLIAEKYRD